MIDLTKLVTAAQKISALKTAKNLEINGWRMAANFSTFPHLGKTIACDELSRSDIAATNGEINNRGSMPVNWPGAWKAVDNSYLAITDVPAWNAFYAAMFAAGNANFAKAQNLKAALAAATTAVQIAQVVW